MGLSPKPARPVATSAGAVEDFLARGGSVPEPASVEAPDRSGKGAQHPLKFPADSDLFDRLERARAASVVKLPRNTWILQAIAEKLARDAG